MQLRVIIPDLVSPSYFPAIAAVEMGFFKKEGFDATLELVFPVTRAYEELRERKADLVGGVAPGPVDGLRRMLRENSDVSTTRRFLSPRRPRF